MNKEIWCWGFVVLHTACTHLYSKDRGAVAMTRTVRSWSHKLWIWYGQSDPPAIMVIAEEGSERTKASGLSHTLHISCSTYSKTAVISHLGHRKGEHTNENREGRCKWSVWEHMEQILKKLNHVLMWNCNLMNWSEELDITPKKTLFGCISLAHPGNIFSLFPRNK